MAENQNLNFEEYKSEVLASGVAPTIIAKL